MRWRESSVERGGAVEVTVECAGEAVRGAIKANLGGHYNQASSAKVDVVKDKVEGGNDTGGGNTTQHQLTTTHCRPRHTARRLMILSRFEPQVNVQHQRVVSVGGGAGVEDVGKNEGEERVVMEGETVVDIVDVDWT